MNRRVIKMTDVKTLDNMLKKIVNSSSKTETTSLLYATYATIILSTELFKLNIDLVDFLTPILKKLQSQPEFSRLKRPIEFKEYVYKSRSLIIARFIRIIQKSDDKSIDILIEEAQALVNSKLNNHPKSKKDSLKPKKTRKNSVDELLKEFGRY